MKVMHRFLIQNITFLLFISLFSLNANAEQLYKWVDEQGKVTYQSGPPPESAVDVEESNIRLSVESEEEPAEVIEVTPIKFFTKPECPSCNEARTFFEENEISVEEIDLIENESEAEALKKKLGHNNAPTFVIGGTSISGFKKETLKNILNKAGYSIQIEE